MRTRNDSKEQASAPEPPALRATLDANPDLRRAWHDAQAYRETFATPEEARAATALLADLDRMDALFFSPRPEDHAELARAVASLDPSAFASFAHAMTALAKGNVSPVGARYIVPGADAWRDAAHPPESPERNGSVGAQHAVPSDDPWRRDAHPASHSNSAVIPRSSPQRTTRNPSTFSQNGPDANPRGILQAETPGLQNDGASDVTPAQLEFFHSANASAVKNVLDAIESQVERLLPESVSKSARNRVVGEIYRELDTTLQSNRQLAQQMREAFRHGSLDADHERAIVSLITGRARQALPGVAKRVLNEWTSTLVAANHDRRARQRAAERRVDIAGSGGASNDGIRSMTPRDIDYSRLSDSDILNL